MESKCLSVSQHTFVTQYVGGTDLFIHIIVYCHLWVPFLMNAVKQLQSEFIGTSSLCLRHHIENLSL